MREKFYCISHDTAKDFVPSKSLSHNVNKHIVPIDLRNLMRKWSGINKILSRVTSPSRKNNLKDELYKIEESLIISYQNSKNIMEDKAVEAINKNTKYFLIT